MNRPRKLIKDTSISKMSNKNIKQVYTNITRQIDSNTTPRKQYYDNERDVPSHKVLDSSARKKAFD